MSPPPEHAPHSPAGPLRRLSHGLMRRFKDNRDVLSVWLLLAIAQPIVPVNHLLARADLGPWIALTLSGVALLRGRRIGVGAHPMLTRRVSSFARGARQLAMVAIPWILLLLHDAVAELSVIWFGIAMVIAGAVAILLAIGRPHDQTAWNPPGLPSALPWLLGSALMMILAAGTGLVPPHLDWVGIGGLVGLSFLAIGLVDGRVQHIRQRKRARLKNGEPYKVEYFPYGLAFAGPGVGYIIVALILDFLPWTSKLDYSQAYVVSLHVVVWASVIWPRPQPVARACLLHEVVPTGGGDKDAKISAQSFERPPEGALRFNPLRIKRIRVVHPWMVPVRGARIAELDDPVGQLWDRGVPLLPAHILGDAAFEPDPITKESQWDVITVRLVNQGDDGVKSSTGAATRRIVILRAFPSPGSSRSRDLVTYRWEASVPRETRQIITAKTPAVTLRDGDVLVMSSEGVARAFEVELGEPVYDNFRAKAFRAPQLEDYVEV